MSLLTYYLEYGSNLAQLRRRRRRRAYAPTSNTASHDNHEKIHSWVTFSFLYEYGASLGGPSGRQGSAIIIVPFVVADYCCILDIRWCSSAGRKSQTIDLLLSN